MNQARLWTNDTELLAQLVELISVMASERRIKEPVDVRRPSWLRAGSRAGNAYSEAISRMRASGPPPRS